MLERKASSFLNGWKCRRHRALVIEGMRGVGKTTVVDLFGTTYGSYLRIPMDEPANAGMFNGCSDVDEAIRILNLRFGGMRFVPRDTLIFLDEIGGCPGAVRLLAEFSADGRYDIIAADSFPGAENEYDGLDRYTMRPLDFEEFLWATGRRKDLVAAIREFLADQDPLTMTAVDVFSNEFRDHMMVGGMPAAVQAFTEGNGFTGSDRALDTLLRSLRDDVMHRGEQNGGRRALDCLDSLPAQLSRANKRFMYSDVEKGGSRGSARRFSRSIGWLERTGYVNAVRAVDDLKGPLDGNLVPGMFRLYAPDTGMLVRMCPDTAGIRNALADWDLSYRMGMVAENIVAECLVKSGFTPYYYRRTNGEGRLELDFVLENRGRIVAIEVETGKKREAPSLDVVDRRFEVDRKIVFGSSNTYVDDRGVEHYPLFAAAFMDSIEPQVKIKKEKIGEIEG